MHISKEGRTKLENLKIRTKKCQDCLLKALMTGPYLSTEPGKCTSDQSENGPVRDYGAESRNCSLKSRCRKVPALSEIRTWQLAKKRGGLAKKCTFVAKT